MKKNAPKDTMGRLQDSVVKFRDARDWKQFHNPKDTSLSLVLEAAELMEHFQWKNPEEIEAYLKTNKDDVAEELADVLYWVLLIGHDLNIDIPKAFKAKLKKNDEKYPVEKSKGRHSKYTEYQK
jgi:NTP pyrophosphatase (non-canonical NTP hydrolase)